MKAPGCWRRNASGECEECGNGVSAFSSSVLGDKSVPFFFRVQEQVGQLIYLSTGDEGSRRLTVTPGENPEGDLSLPRTANVLSCWEAHSSCIQDKECRTILRAVYLLCGHETANIYDIVNGAGEAIMYRTAAFSDLSAAAASFRLISRDRVYWKLTLYPLILIDSMFVKLLRSFTPLLPFEDFKFNSNQSV
ncbi:unnamed protein product [Notodromas monacha]|uniref:Uncharacterized protein n=1 Tax=Notodromas monacha TaxID=399045 RepID=A0A7R9BX10_9CRUS|nr:unnamed protein product [Notodromas monacha]CAG0922372.1 unnamed protein product [Notodromas monacha]